jgi:hypothetical protein
MEKNVVNKIDFSKGLEAIEFTKRGSRVTLNFTNQESPKEVSLDPRNQTEIDISKIN